MSIYMKKICRLVSIVNRLVRINLFIILSIVKMFKLREILVFSLKLMYLYYYCYVYVI